MRNSRLKIDNFFIGVMQTASAPTQTTVRVKINDKEATFLVTRQEATLIEGEIPPSILERLTTCIVRGHPPRK